MVQDRCFNPRTREGCDNWGRYILLFGGRVSIHAPVKGATSATETVVVKSGVSIHAPVKGATTLHPFVVNFRDCFNPRTREGCDIY